MRWKEVAVACLDILCAAPRHISRIEVCLFDLGKRFPKSTWSPRFAAFALRRSWYSILYGVAYPFRTYSLPRGGQESQDAMPSRRCCSLIVVVHLVVQEWPLDPLPVLTSRSFCIPLILSRKQMYLEVIIKIHAVRSTCDPWRIFISELRISLIIFYLAQDSVLQPWPSSCCLRWSRTTSSSTRRYKSKCARCHFRLKVSSSIVFHFRLKVTHQKASREIESVCEIVCVFSMKIFRNYEYW